MHTGTSAAAFDTAFQTNSGASVLQMDSIHGRPQNMHVNSVSLNELVYLHYNKMMPVLCHSVNFCLLLLSLLIC
jgi:hypothetical protein